MSGGGVSGGEGKHVGQNGAEDGRGGWGAAWGERATVIFHETPLHGVFLIEPEKRGDDRGFFARVFCEDEFAAHGLETRFVQANNSLTGRKGTLRGMHFQVAPYAQAKLVRCTAGAIFDAIIDLRPESETFLKFAAMELTQRNRDALYIPPGFAHGFQTLVDETEVFYQMTDVFRPELARGLRWNDPLFAIPWPDDDRLIHARDAQYPDFKPGLAGRRASTPDSQH